MNVTGVDLSDIKSPKFLYSKFAPMMISKTSGIPSCDFSPNGETIIYSDKFNLKVLNTSEPTNLLTLSDDTNEWAFSSDSVFTSNYGGYTCGNSLYTFSVLSTEMTELFPLASSCTTLLLSNDNTTLFIVDASSILHILNVSDYMSPKIISKYTFSQQPGSAVISSDNTRLYVVLESGIQIIDISNRSKPSLLAEYDENVVPIYPRLNYCYLSISPDANTLIVYGNSLYVQYIIDISDVNNPIVLQSSVLDVTGRGFSSSFIFDNEHIMTIVQDNLQIGNILVNKVPGALLSYTESNMDIEIVQTELPPYDAAVTSSGDQMLLTTSQGLEFYNISSDQKNFTKNYNVPLEGGEFSNAKRIILSDDDTTAFVYSDNRLDIVDIPQQKLMTSIAFNSPSMLFFLSSDSKTIMQVISSVPGYDNNVLSLYNVSDLTQGINSTTILGSGNSNGNVYTTNWNIVVFASSWPIYFTIFKFSDQRSLTYSDAFFANLYWRFAKKRGQGIFAKSFARVAKT